MKQQSVPLPEPKSKFKSTQEIMQGLVVFVATALLLAAAACEADLEPPATAGATAGRDAAFESPRTKAVPTAGTRQPPIPSPPATSAQPALSPAPAQTPHPSIPMPTPHPDNTDWVRQRLDAVIGLYRPTPAGAALLHSLDVRQMQGEPGFFGSYGFNGWAGVGEAKPIPLMHELGHSYWGGFPVIGRAELDWQRPDDGGVAPALAAYHRDILTFMAQPPDEFEILRQRLRNLPGLSADNNGPLFHSMEADIPYTTGGDLRLVPPILRGYWGYFLTEGPFGTWEQAGGWLRSLSREERLVAGKFLGFEHLDLRLYQGIPAYFPPADPLTAAAEILSGEERQRLTDFAGQFDLLIGDPQLEEDFRFWRGYLRDKVMLQRVHPDHLGSLSVPRAHEISGALDFLAELDGSPEAQAAALEERIASQPFLVNFLPAINDAALVELFAAAPALPDRPILQATASFVERLRRFGALVDWIVVAGHRSPAEGASALLEYLDDTGPGQEQDIKLFFDLLHSADTLLAREIVAELDGKTIQSLMAVIPVRLRTLLDPQKLLEKLDITTDAREEELSGGMALLLEETSGNYRIDEPFIEQLCRVMADRAERDPAAAAGIVADARFPLEEFILSQPAAASRVLSADIETALDLVESSDPVLSPPARIIHRLIVADPHLAARLVDGLYRRGETGLVADMLAYFAYDKSRSEKFPGLPISVEQDGVFLEGLLTLNDADWLADQLSMAIRKYRAKEESGEIPPEFLSQYRQTLSAAAARPPVDSRILAEVIERAFASP